MPAYPAHSPVFLSPGNQVVLVNNAATDTGITKTIQCSVAAQPTATSKLTLVNNTNQTATVQVAAVDADASYVPLTTSITAAAGAAVIFDCVGPFVRCSFATAPTTGSLYLCR
jgi:gamma-glutamyltranspeptidase